MDKLLSSKFLVLSVLALVASESQGMKQQQVFALLNPIAQNGSMQHNLSSAKDQVLAKCSSEEQRKILSDLSNKQVHRIVFQWWMKNRGVGLHNDITSGAIWGFLTRQSESIKDIIEYICQNQQEGKVPISGIKQANPDLHSTRANWHQYVSKNERKNLLNTWDKGSSPAWAWLKRLGLLKQSSIELVNLLESTAQRYGVSLNIPRDARQNRHIFAQYLDCNWGVLQPVLGQISMFATIPPTQQPNQ